MPDIPIHPEPVSVGRSIGGAGGAGFVKVDANGLILDPADSTTIEASEIADGAVTTSKIAAGAVTTAKLASGAVTTTELGADAVTAAKIADAVIDVEHISSNLKNGLSLDSESLTDFTHLIGASNVGEVVAKKNGTNYDVYLPCGPKAWQKWEFNQSASGRDHRIRNPKVYRFYKWFPLTARGVTWSAKAYRFSVNTYAPTSQALVDNTTTATVYFTGSGRCIVYFMSRTSSADATITLSGTNGLFDSADITTTLVNSGTDFGEKFVQVAENLPYDTYTMTITCSTFVGCYPIAVGIENDTNKNRATPYQTDQNRVYVGPYRAFSGRSAAWVDIQNAADGDYYPELGNMAMSATSLTADTDFIYLAAKDGQEFDRVDMTFTSVNNGSGGSTRAQYWNGSAWANLTVSTDTMRQSTLPLGGNGYIQFAIPSDWANTTVNSVSGRWIRLGSSAAAGNIDIATCFLRLKWQPSELVFTVSAQDSEFEPVLNRSENPSDDDIGGGHGNVSRTSFTLTMDGTDATTALDAGKAVVGKCFEAYQALNALTAEAGSTIGTITERHRFGAGAISVQYIFTAGATVTMSPWAYSAMFPIDFSTSFTHYDIFYRGRTVRAALPSSGVQTSAVECCGARFTSSSYPYTAGVLQRLPQTANFNWDYSVSKCFIYNSGSNIKFYSQSSDSTAPKTLSNGDIWCVDNIYFVAPI